MTVESQTNRSAVGDGLPPLGVLLAGLPARLAGILANGLEWLLCFWAKRALALFRAWRACREQYRNELAASADWWEDS